MNALVGRILFVCLSLVFAPGGVALGEARIALIVGNGAYGEIGPLKNAGEDARLIASTLVGLGFETTLVLDADQEGMKTAIADFGRRLRRAGPDTAGLFYYAGHGIQARGSNYLMPVEANPTHSADLDLMGVEANWVLRQMESAGNRTNIVILDACRNNPFAANDRSVSRGLARIEAPTGSFVSYATAPGAVAADGDGINSPFTTALAEALTEPGLAIEQVFKRVRVNVISETDGVQTPWDSSSLVHDFYFNAKKTAPAPAPVADPAELSLWQGISKTDDPNRVSLFLQVFPDGQFAPEARELLKKLMVNQTLAAAAPATTPAVEAPPPVQREVTPQPAAPVQPTISEAEMFVTAQSAGTPEAFEAYLAAFPDGRYAGLAQAELAVLMAATASSQAKEEPVQLAATTPTGPLGFDQPLQSGSDAVLGRSISELAQGKPVVPPVEGLPDSVWAHLQCSGCHNWNRKNLCDQGNFYAGKEDSVVSRIKHPYQGDFKLALKRWASEGCN